MKAIPSERTFPARRPRTGSKSFGPILAAAVFGLAVGAYLIYSRVDTRLPAAPEEDERSYSAAVTAPPGEGGIDASVEPGIEAAEPSATLDTNLGELESDASTVSSSLPPLNASDAFVRGLAPAVSADAESSGWLTSPDLVRKWTMLAQNLAQGNVPSRYFGELAPAGPFEFEARGVDGYVLTPRGYERYRRFADVIGSVNTQSAMALYLEIKPLFQQAFTEFRAPGEEFDDTLLRAIDMLLKAPVIEGEIPLVRPSVAFKFADPGLESLPAAQKQLIRMGPRNTRIIQGKLAEFAQALRSARAG